MPFSGHQFKIYSFKPGSLPASRVRTARSKAKADFGVEVELAEYTINHHASEILIDIYLHHADLVCFSCYIWNIEYVRQLVRNLKNLCPNVKIWVGGPEVSYDCESFLRSLLQVDGILYGEGEKSFPALIEYYAARERCKSIIQNISRWGGMAG